MSAVVPFNRAVAQQQLSGEARPTLRTLRPRHRLILNDYASGLPVSQICEARGVSPGAVYRVLNDPLGRIELERALSADREHLKHLQHKAIEAVRTGLTCGDPKLKLEAVDRYIKLASHLGLGEVQAVDTAEDVIGRILQQINVQVNINQTPERSEAGLGTASLALTADEVR